MPSGSGPAINNTRLGFRHTTSQITPHIAPDIDAERDKPFQDLEHTGALSEVYVVEGSYKVREGRNVGGDP